MKRLFAFVLLFLFSLGGDIFAQTETPAATSPAAVAAPAANPAPAAGQRRGRGGANQGPPTLGLEQGTLDFSTPDFDLKLVKASQTIAALQPKNGNGFDFTPADRLTARANNRYSHLGDLDFRVRTGDTGNWTDYSTYLARQPVTALAAVAPALASADLGPTLPPDCPLQVTRTWLLEAGKLVLRFELKNKSSTAVQIGALGIPMVFNNIFTGRNAAQMYDVCSFSDPSIAQDAGYVQVTRLNGQGPALLVVPDGRTPLEAWRVITSDPMGRGNAFEGVFDWMVLAKAYAENEWRNAKQWNEPNAVTLAPGEAKTYGVKFLVAPALRDMEKTLAANARPVAVGLPGYILPMDQDGKLFLNYPHKIASIEADPPGAIAVEEQPATPGGWKAYILHGKNWGRARLTVNYDDGTRQTISYYVTKPAPEAVGDLGNFLFTRHWYLNPDDPFHRSPSVMTYDRGNNRIVQQDARAWIAGLGDEGGSGSWLTAAMKEFGEPKKDEVAKFEQFIDGVLWGGLQYSEGPRQYGVKKSLFYYDRAALPDFPYDPAINWGSWTSWNKAASEAVNRAYNYPHVVAAYWAMYRLARNHPGLATAHTWDWYLNQAFLTAHYLGSHNNIANSRDGLMDGTVLLLVLEDLKREKWPDQVALLETQLKTRADDWNSRAYPFGSEMAWDSTGQEEIYGVTKLFGHDDKAALTLQCILGYMPTVPHWGYNGNARRYWDFFYGAAPGGTTERQLHHYGSGLNAIPVLAAYRENPEDFYLLRVGYGGTMGAISNIDQEGFAGTAFHSFPQNLRWDTYSGDYGPNFFGHAVNTATYIVNHPEFGWQTLGGNVKAEGDWIKIRPLDSFRQRVYVAPRGLWLTLDAGTFDAVEVNSKTHAVRVGLAKADEHTPQARLRVEQPAKVSGVGAYHPVQALQSERDAYTVPLGAATTWVELTD